MKTIFTILIISIITVSSFAQTHLRGEITNEKGEKIIGANVYLKDTYDGASTDISGFFSFNSDETGEQTLIISAIGYKEYTQPIDLIQSEIIITTSLKEQINKMDGVIINAGAFEASDERKAVVLKPLDIATTAGAVGDIMGAINTLPGTQTVGESGKSSGF